MMIVMVMTMIIINTDKGSVYYQQSSFVGLNITPKTAIFLGASRRPVILDPCFRVQLEFTRVTAMVILELTSIWFAFTSATRIYTVCTPGVLFI